MYKITERKSPHFCYVNRDSYYIFLYIFFANEVLGCKTVAFDQPLA